MKRYLLVGIALLFVSANASLKEDFAKMDLEEEQLLSDMRKSAALTGEEYDEEETVVPEKSVELEKVEEEEVVPSSPEENSAQMAASLDAVTSEPKRVDDEEGNAWMQSEAYKMAVEEAQKVADTEEALKAEIVAKEAEIKQVKAEEAVKAQREAEKLEVEAYEKQRAEKLAKEAAEKAELEQKQLAQKALEEEALKKESASKEEAVSAALDVNISRELEVKTQAAEEEYENAIKEMNTEKLAKEAAQKSELENTQVAQKALEKEKEAASKKIVVSSALDVNISRELEVKTQAAEEEYENAIKEMNEEG